MFSDPRIVSETERAVNTKVLEKTCFRYAIISAAATWRRVDVFSSNNRGGFVLVRTRWSAAFTLLVLAFFAVGCGGDEETPASQAAGGQSGKPSVSEAPKILATTPQVANLVNNVAGSRTSAAAIVPIGTNPHTFQPQASATLADVDIAFINGGDIDPWAKAAIKQASPNAQIVDLSKSVKLLKRSGRSNAHWITNLENANSAAQKVKETLSAADPSGASSYAENATNFTSLATAVDQAITECTEENNLDSKLRVVAAHNDLDYLADRYGFEVVEQLSPSGEDTEPSASPQTLGRRAKQKDATVVATAFAQMDAPGGLVAQAAGVPKVTVYTDTLSDPGQPANTLIRSVAHSFGVMVESSTEGKTRCKFPRDI